jgi:hypothetical protein
MPCRVSVSLKCVGKNVVQQDYSIYSSQYQITLRGQLKFELDSLLGRTFLNRKPPSCPKGTDHMLLHLGCAKTKFKGWVNADFFKGFKPWRSYPKRPDWMLDLRYPLNCDSDHWDGVFCEHTLEHLYPNVALNLLKEIYRTMRVSAYVRLSVPDLERYIAYYNGEKSDQNFSIWETGCEAIRSLTQNYLHLSVWDYKLLQRFLGEAGFRNIRKVSYREGSDQRLLKDLDDRKWESLYIEAQK